MKKTKLNLDKKATAIGISKRTLYSWRKAGCPVEKSEAEILNWAMEEHKRTPDSAATAKARRVVLEETAIKLKRQNAVGAGELISLASVQLAADEAEAYYAGELDRSIRELPPALCGLSAAQIYSVMEKFFTDLKQRSREKFAAVAKVK